MTLFPRCARARVVSPVREPLDDQPRPAHRTATTTPDAAMTERFNMRAALRKLRRKPRAPLRPAVTRVNAGATETRRRRPTPYALSRDPTAGGDNWREVSVLPQPRAPAAPREERTTAGGEPALREAAPYAMVSDPNMRDRWCEYVPTLPRGDLDVPTNRVDSDDSGVPTEADEPPASPVLSIASTEPSDASAQDAAESGADARWNKAPEREDDAREDAWARELLARREAAPYGMTHDPTTSGRWREPSTSRQRRDAYKSFIVARELEEELCCICLEPFGLKDVAKGDCRHMFHTACIAEWMAKDDEARSCPVCRLPFMSPENLRYCFVKR